MESFQIHAIIRTGVLRARALAAWIATLPPTWQCHLVSADPNRALKTNHLDHRTTLLGPEIHEVLCAPGAMTLLLSDDGALCTPSATELQRAHAANSVLLTVPEAAPAVDAYSPKQSARPDHYLAAPAIPGTHMRALWNSDATVLTRWIGHEIGLRARHLGIPVSFARTEGACLPALRQIRGTDLIQTRAQAPRILDILCGDGASVVPEVSQAAIRAAIEISRTLPAYTSPVNADPHREQKKQIDSTLSSITAELAPQSMAPAAHDVQPPQIRGKNVVIFKVESIGDCILSLDLISRVYASEPAHLTIVTTEEFASLLDQTNPRVTILALNKQWVSALGHPSPGESLDRILQLLEAPLAGMDVALFPRYYPDYSFSRQVAMLLGIPVRAGLFNPRSDEGRYYNRLYDQMLTHVVSVPDDLHESKKIACFGDGIGLPNSRTTDFGLLRRRSTDHSTDRSTIAIGLGALIPNRRWPVEPIVELVVALHGFDSTLSFVLLGGTDVVEAAKTIQGALPFEVINQTGTQTLNQTAEALRGCTLYIGNDSGAMHLAAAVGTPVVEISMHPAGAPANHVNSPARFGPVGVEFEAVRPKTPAAEECTGGCIGQTAHCIRLVASEDVFKVAKAMLDKIGNMS